MVLRVRELQDRAAPEGRRLLRVLLVRHETVPADTSERIVLLLWMSGEGPQAVCPVRLWKAKADPGHAHNSEEQNDWDWIREYCP